MIAHGQDTPVKASKDPLQQNHTPPKNVSMDSLRVRLGSLQSLPSFSLKAGLQVCGEQTRAMMSETDYIAWLQEPYNNMIDMLALLATIHSLHVAARCFDELCVTSQLLLIMQASVIRYNQHQGSCLLLLLCLCVPVLCYAFLGFGVLRLMLISIRVAVCWSLSILASGQSTLWRWQAGDGDARWNNA